MKELTDLEICKRIAEIEGVQHQYEMYDSPHCYIYSEELNKEYNPLTDDALCFQLMVKHGVDFANHKDYYEATFVMLRHIPLEIWDSIKDKSPNRAICLAIIEANQDR